MEDKTPLFHLARVLSDADRLVYSEEMQRLQGNILKGHGRNTSASVLVTFLQGKVDAAKRFLRELPITSAAEQRVQRFQHTDELQEDLFVGLYLSSSGYEFLGVPVSSFSYEFREGMRGAEARLTDPPVSQWEEKFRPSIHAMILLAHDRMPDLIMQLGLLRNRCKDICTSTSEIGLVMTNASGKPIEHFGYVDGLSQPLFFQEDLAKTSTNNWDPSAGPNLVLVRDPLGSSDLDCGTYYVFRKLEQNVRGFRKRVQALADALNLTAENRALAGAMVIGRFEDGTPLVMSGRATGKAGTNDFAYPSTDPGGHKCPFAAHIRKANPRGDSIATGMTLEEERAHRIARRGITYGDPTPPGDDLDALPEKAVGLLFQCCQASLSDQFEFIQRVWANNAERPIPSSSLDPLTGQSSMTPPDVKFPRGWSETTRIPFGFHGFVTLKGGEYFFAPSISFIRSL